MNDRPTLEDIFMSVAEMFAQRSTCSRLHVGCVITKDERIISTGYNGPLPGEPHCNSELCQTDSPCTRAIHAEANALTFALRVGLSVSGSSIYVTHTPCVKCSELIILSGIEKVIYKNEYRDHSKIQSLFERNGVKLIKKSVA